VLVALIEVEEGQAAIDRAIIPILSLQNDDGGWGMPQTNAEETAYAVLALRALAGAGVRATAIDRALWRGEQWMQHHYAPFRSDSFTCWTAKQPFRVSRLSQAIELAATFPQDINQPLRLKSVGGYV
jgi:hypothetical protein